MRCTHANNGRPLAKTLLLRDTLALHWKVRVENRDNTTYTNQLVYHL